MIGLESQKQQYLVIYLCLQPPLVLGHALINYDYFWLDKNLAPPRLHHQATCFPRALSCCLKIGQTMSMKLGSPPLQTGQLWEQWRNHGRVLHSTTIKCCQTDHGHAQGQAYETELVAKSLYKIGAIFPLCLGSLMSCKCCRLASHHKIAKKKHKNSEWIRCTRFHGQWKIE